MCEFNPRFFTLIGLLKAESNGTFLVGFNKVSFSDALTEASRLVRLSLFTTRSIRTLTSKYSICTRFKYFTIDCHCLYLSDKKSRRNLLVDKLLSYPYSLTWTYRVFRPLTLKSCSSVPFRSAYIRSAIHSVRTDPTTEPKKFGTNAIRKYSDHSLCGAVRLIYRLKRSVGSLTQIWAGILMLRKSLTLFFPQEADQNMETKLCS